MDGRRRSSGEEAPPPTMDEDDFVPPTVATADETTRSGEVDPPVATASSFEATGAHHDESHPLLPTAAPLVFAGEAGPATSTPPPTSDSSSSLPFPIASLVRKLSSALDQANETNSADSTNLRTTTTTTSNTITTRRDSSSASTTASNPQQIPTTAKGRKDTDDATMPIASATATVNDNGNGAGGEADDSDDSREDEHAHSPRGPSPAPTLTATLAAYYEVVLRVLTSRSFVRARVLGSAWAYIVGSFLYLLGSIYLVPEWRLPIEGAVWSFVIGSLLFLLAAVVDLAAAVYNWLHVADVLPVSPSVFSRSFAFRMARTSFMSRAQAASAGVSGSNSPRAPHIRHLRAGGASGRPSVVVVVPEDVRNGHDNDGDDDDDDANVNANANGNNNDDDGVDEERPRQVPVHQPPAERLRTCRLPSAAEQVVTGTLYLLGGLLFTIGSFVFWPKLNYPPGTGTLVFRWGSFCYIAGSTYGIVQLLWPPVVSTTEIRSDTCWLGAVNPLGRSACVWIATKLQFIVGSLHFLLGGVLFLRGLVTLGAWVWILGSVLFVSGSFTSLYGIVRVDRI